VDIEFLVLSLSARRVVTRIGRGSRSPSSGGQNSTPKHRQMFRRTNFGWLRGRATDDPTTRRFSFDCRGPSCVHRLTAATRVRTPQGAFGNQIALNGHPDLRLPNTLNVSFVGRVGADILAHVPDIAASTGSACHAGEFTLSPVLDAMGIAPEVGMGAVRFSLGRSTTELKEQIARFLHSHKNV
jgi:hypothetical protein